MRGMASVDASTGERLGEVVIEPRYNGPVESANGGYACGCLAAFVGESAEITLRQPPPLARPLAVVSDGAAGARMLDGEVLVAEGRPAALDAIEPPLRPSFDEATAASARHPGRGMRHLLSDCFVCSPYRDKPGRPRRLSRPLAADASLNAAPFEPDASLADDGVVRHEVVWAALDCPSYPPSLWASPPEMWASGRVALLGRLSAERRRRSKSASASSWWVGCSHTRAESTTPHRHCSPATASSSPARSDLDRAAQPRDPSAPGAAARCTCRRTARR